MKKILRFLGSRFFLINIALAIGITGVLIAGTLIFLHFYTDHGEAYTVPDFIGLQEPEVKDICNQHDFNYKITDSIYSEKVDLGAIAEQHPVGGSKVKTGRTIYLIKNSEMPEMVDIPDVFNISLRQARSVLETYGFKIGELEYIPDIGENVVLRLKVDGKLVDKGEEVLKGETVDLVLGQGLSNDKTYIPNVKGLPLDEATKILNDKFLNVGAVMFDNTVKNEEDSLSAKIYKQYPAFNLKNFVNMGEAVDVWLSADTVKIPEYVPDSVAMDSITADSIIKAESEQDYEEID